MIMETDIKGVVRMNIGDRIRNLRKEKNLSQEEVAEELQISRQSVSKWESGQSVPEISKVIQLSDLLGVSTDDLLRGTEEGSTNGPSGEEKKSARRIGHLIVHIISGVVIVFLLLVIWSIMADITEHNNDRYISAFHAMGEFTEEAEQYLEAESFEERKEFGERMDKKYSNIINRRRGVIRLYAPVLKGDRDFDRVVSDIVIYSLNPLWSLTSILPEDRTEGGVSERGRELNEEEEEYFTALLSELEEYRWINEGEIENLNRSTRREIIEESRGIIQRSRELYDQHRNN